MICSIIELPKGTALQVWDATGIGAAKSASMETDFGSLGHETGVVPVLPNVWKRESVCQGKSA